MPSRRKKQIISAAARKYHIDPAVLYGVWGAETDFGRNKNTSSAGAVGDFQFMPGTARGLGVDPYNFRQAAFGAAKYLSQYKDRGVKGMLAAYNAGPAGNPNNPETRAYVPRVLELAKTFGRGSGGGGLGAGPGRIRIPGTPGSSEFIAGVDNSPTRRQLKLDYLNNSHDPDALLNLAYGLKNARDVPSRTVRTPGTPGRFAYRSGKVAAPGKLDSILAEANLLDAANNAGKLPYQWGGGHQGKVKPGSKAIPVDCSGAVSRLLGINPRVASEFMSWGKAGRGKRVTIWAKGDHVLMEINGRFFGTSRSNPGGGAGWIPRRAISKQYLSQFTARHPPGL